MTIADILTAAAKGADAVTALCERAGMTDDALRAEIERIGIHEPNFERLSTDSVTPRYRQHYAAQWRDARQARGALETERDRRAKAAMIATLPEALR